MKNDKRIPIIEAGISEAERFIKVAKLAIKRLELERDSEWRTMSTKETGAVKRAALDLKRAMTDINQMKTF